jgi:hypothetical protein
VTFRDGRIRRAGRMAAIGARRGIGPDVHFHLPPPGWLDAAVEAVGGTCCPSGWRPCIYGRAWRCRASQTPGQRFLDRQPCGRWRGRRRWRGYDRGGDGDGVVSSAFLSNMSGSGTSWRGHFLSFSAMGCRRNRRGTTSPRCGVSCRSSLCRRRRCRRTGGVHWRPRRGWGGK